jgi:hypothetical protein
LAKEPGVEIGIGCGLVAVVAALLIIWGISVRNSTITHSVFVVATILFIVWIAICSVRQISIQRKVVHNRQSWPRIERRWGHLYYCHRDDLVFYEDDTSCHVPSSQMRSLLFEGLDLI